MSSKPPLSRTVAPGCPFTATGVFEDFRYTREIGEPGGRDHALMFQARIGDKQIEGCDFLRTDRDGAIDELIVMVRPLSGANALAEAMREQLGLPGRDDAR